jgi:stage II sporulation protein R
MLLLAGLACLLLIVGVQYEKRRTLQAGIAGKVIRFHVIADNDSETDQERKLAVRDAVGSYLSERLADVDDTASCEEIILASEEEIIETANRVLAELGASYGARMELADTEFPAKMYGSYLFPSGTYRAMRLILGEGAGQNWWCVVYPNMCFSGSVYEVVEGDAESLRAVLTKEEYEDILFTGNYEIRFKYLDFLSKLSVGIS